MIFRNIVFSAVLVGLISSLIYSVFQQWQISPIIHAAEQYEVANEPHSPKEFSSTENDYQTHNHNHEAWSPKDGWPRVISTLIANSLMGIGFALILICAMLLHNLKSRKSTVSWKTGLLWGAITMIIVYIAPAVSGLPPEIPGTVAQGLHHRQTWWISTALSTGIGLGILYYSSLRFKGIGLIFIAVPQAIRAPQPNMHSFSNTDSAVIAALDALTQQFILMSGIGMAIFCLLLGALSGQASSLFRFDSIIDHRSK
ncbi:MAG: hypothetical protein GKR96_12030 [Gammaproteobacteria bacterium]|nr:hypothetical protein [Gammaproteobacteria bacterium]